MSFLKKFAEEKKAQTIQEELSNYVFKAAKDVEKVMEHGFRVAKDTKDGDFANNLQNESNRLRKINTDLLMIAGNIKSLTEKPEQ